jgi:hypothetical protein
MNKLKDKALDILKNNKDNLNLISEIGIDYYCNMLTILAENKIDVENELKQIVKEISRNGELIINKKIYSSIPILNVIVKVIEKDAKKVKNYINEIRKIIQFINNQFDDVYLLIKNNKFDNETLYIFDENMSFVSTIDELSQILNLEDYHKESDQLVILKSKIDLGIQRYFFNKKYKIWLHCFDSNYYYSICDTLDLFKLKFLYGLDKTFTKEEIDKVKKEFKCYRFGDSLIIAKKFLESHKVKNIDKDFIKLLEVFPREIVEKNDYIMEKDIEKSLGKNIEEANEKQKYIILKEGYVVTAIEYLNLENAIPNRYNS